MPLRGWASAAANAALLLLGLLCGVWSAFLVPTRLFGHVPGSADLFALASTYGAGRLGVLATGRLSGAAWPGAGWALAFVGLGLSAPGGDVVVPGRLPADPTVVVVGSLDVVAGALGVVLSVVLASRQLRRPTRPGPGLHPDGGSSDIT